MKPIKATMLEYQDDTGNWAWYAIHRKLTPKEAIKLYCDEMLHGATPIIIPDLDYTDGYCDENYSCRAYPITIN